MGYLSLTYNVNLCLMFIRSAFQDSTNADPRTPQKPWERTLRGATTPKTILKHRKMIDSNVRVGSKHCVNDLLITCCACPYPYCEVFRIYDKIT